jgi:integrase
MELATDDDPLAFAIPSRLENESLVSVRQPGHLPTTWPKPGRNVASPVVTAAKVADLIEAIAPRLRVIVLLGAYCGLRRGEILALRRTDVDLLHGRISVTAQHQQLRDGTLLVANPKTSAGRRPVLIPRALLPALDAHLAEWAGPGPDELFFVGIKGGPLRPHVWQKQWNGARIAAGVPDLHFHDLRHFAGTSAASTGASIRELMAFLGHATPRAALIYQHATEEGATAIAAAMSVLIEASSASPNAPIASLPANR